MSRARSTVYRALDASDGGGGIERLVDWSLLTLVIVNAAAVILESVSSLDRRYHPVFAAIELTSVYFFSCEYIGRVWTCVENPKYAHPFWGRLRYVLTPMALIDLLAILPFYFALGQLDLRFLRLVRLFRLLKVVRYVKALTLIQLVVRRKRGELAVSLGVISLLLIIVSCLMFFIEGDAQPDKFGSIPDTMWWGVATLTTVGYGDVYPITPGGKILSGFIAVLGLGLFALPTGILAAGFAEQLSGQQAPKEHPKYCPHCGNKL